MKQKISIIGCGWLGFPLAKALIDKGYSVKGSTTSEAKLSKLKAANIDDFLIQLTAEGMVGDNKDFLADSHTIIINIPPGIRKNSGKNHVAELQHLMSAIDNLNKKYKDYKIKLGNQDLERTWKMRQERLSPRYTTNINEIITVK